MYDLDPILQDYASYPVHFPPADAGERTQPTVVSRKLSPVLAAIGDAGDAFRGPNTAAAASLTVMGAVLKVAVYGAAGWYAGKAMAPDDSEAAYKWGGMVTSVFFGAVGLGVIGAVTSWSK